MKWFVHDTVEFSIPMIVIKTSSLTIMYFVLKTEAFVKLFFLVSCTGFLMYAVLAFYTFHTAYSSISQSQQNEDNIPSLHEYKNFMKKYIRDLKYILVWTLNETSDMGVGQEPFIAQECMYSNCYLTDNKFLLGKDYTQFDAIVFDVRIFVELLKKGLPDSRSHNQKYIFYSNISSDEVPVCSVFADNYFNWTWTYRFDSDIFAPFIEVKDLEGNVVAPKPVVNWNINMTKLDLKVMKKLMHKKKAVAWIVNKCVTRNDRMMKAKRYQKIFRANDLDFDIFGCGNQECPTEGCLKAIERDYYFYYAPEDSHAKDYVTNEVVIGYNHYAVPIVDGGADYKKFLPDGSYIKVENSPGDRLAALVEYIMKNPNIYQKFHRWRNHYTISETMKFKGLCDICEFLNDANKATSISVKKNFRKWWFPRPLYSRCVPKGAETFSEALAYLNETRRYKNRPW